MHHEEQVGSNGTVNVLDLIQVKFENFKPNCNDTLVGIGSFIFRLAVKRKIESNFSLFA